MKMGSSTLFSVVFTVAMFSAGAAASRVTNVYVTNFPFDAQGNLKVAEANPQENVTIVNLPVDDEGNLKVDIVSNTAFPELLVLRGTVVQLTATAATMTAQNLLLDNRTPFPKVHPLSYLEVQRANPYTVWENIYNRRFVYEIIPQKPYSIQGEILVSSKYAIWQTGGSGGIEARGFFFFEKILSNSTIVTLATANMTEAVVLYGENVFEAGFTFTFATPITIEQGEKIAVRLNIEARNTGTGGIFWFRQYFSMNDLSNDFLVIIPIIS